MAALATLLNCLLALYPLALDAPSVAPEPVVVQGKVLMLAEALSTRGVKIKADPEPTAKQVVLLGDDGAIVPLFADDGSRALFLDERLRHCRTEIQGRRFSGVPYLQVVSFKVEREGRLRTPEYYCEVCAISVPYPQTCPCCQGSMELRMRPDQP